MEEMMQEEEKKAVAFTLVGDGKKKDDKVAVEAVPLTSPSTKSSGRLFIYFGIMQVIVIVTTIISVQHVIVSQESDLKAMHSKLEQIYVEREAKEALSRELAYNLTQAQAAAASAMSALSLIDGGIPALPRAPHSAVPLQVEAHARDGRKGQGKNHRDRHAPEEEKAWHQWRGSEGKYDAPNFKKVTAVPTTGGDWDDGYIESGNCSGALRLPDGRELEQILMPDVKPLPDPRVWLLNVGAGTTGTRSVQREICKRNINSTHWHWHCNLPEDDSSVLAMEEWIKWLQPFYKMTEGDTTWIEKARSGKVRERPHHRVMMDALYGGLVSLGDTPTAFFPELVAWMPEAKVILTLRDAKKWWKSRVDHHAGDLMCAESMWSKVAHPFSIADCYQLGGVDGVINIIKFDERVGIEGYIRYNKWVVSVVPRERLFRFCPWDCRDQHCTEEGSSDYFVKQMLKFIADKCPPPCRMPPNPYPWTGTYKSNPNKAKSGQRQK